MTRPQKQRSGRLLPFSAALTIIALPALAQGTAEQREACAPDAMRLCQDTIPDIERTKACMRRHEAELSPRCRTAFLGASGDRPARERRRAVREEDNDAPVSRPRQARPYGEERRATREAPGDEDAYARPPESRGPDDDEEAYTYPRERVPPVYAAPGVREYRYLGPGGEEAHAADPGDRDRAREEISRLCEEGQMDPETCATTDRALGR